MKYCQKCGKEIDEGAAFCPGCGSAVEQQNSGQTTTQQAQASVSNTSVSNNSTDSKYKVWNTCSIVLMILWGIITIGSPGLLALVAFPTAIFAGTSFSAAKGAETVEKSEKAMRRGQISFAISAILLIIFFILIQVAY